MVFLIFVGFFGAICFFVYVLAYGDIKEGRKKIKKDVEKTIKQILKRNLQEQNLKGNLQKHL